MEDIISAIIDLEYKAQDIIAKAKEEEEREDKLFDQKIEDLQKTIENDADKKIAKLREKELEEAEKECKVHQKACDLKLEEMKKKVAGNKEVWIKELVDKVLAI